MFFKKKEVTHLTREEIAELLGPYAQLEEGRGKLLAHVLSQCDLQTAGDVLIDFLEGDTPDHFESALEILFLLLTKERSVPGKWGSEFKDLLLEQGRIPGVFKTILQSGNFLKTISILSHMRSLEAVFSGEEFESFYPVIKEKNFGLLYFFLLNFGYYEDGRLRDSWLQDLAAGDDEGSSMILLSLTARFEMDHDLAKTTAQASLKSSNPLLALMAQAFLRRPDLIQSIEETRSEEKQAELMDEYEKVHAVLDLDEVITKSYLRVMKENKNTVTSPLLLEAMIKWVTEEDEEKEA